MPNPFSFPPFNEAVTQQEYVRCRELSLGRVSATRAREELQQLGMIVKCGEITNFDQFKLVFQDPDVRHATVLDSSNKKLGLLFLKVDRLYVTKYKK